MSITIPHATDDQTDLAVVQFKDRRREFFVASVLAKQTQLACPSEDAGFILFVGAGSVYGICPLVHGNRAFDVCK